MSDLSRMFVWRTGGRSYRRMDIEYIAQQFAKEKGLEYHHLEFDTANKAVHVYGYKDGRKAMENLYFVDLHKYKLNRQGEQPYLEYDRKVYYKDDMDLFANSYAQVRYGLPMQSYRVSHQKNEITIKCRGGFMNNPTCVVRLMDIERMLVSLINNNSIGV